MCEKFFDSRKQCPDKTLFVLVKYSGDPNSGHVNFWMVVTCPVWTPNSLVFKHHLKNGQNGRNQKPDFLTSILHFTIQKSQRKCPVFQWCQYLNVGYLDPHCTTKSIPVVCGGLSVLYCLLFTCGFQSQ